MNTTKLVLPAEINGSGNPVGGQTPLITAMFRITCTAIMHAIPLVKSEPNLSLQFSAILINDIISTANVKIISVAPKNPSSLS